MTLRQKIKAVRLLGKKVRIRRVEAPDIIGTLDHVCASGRCRIYNGAFYNAWIDEITKS